jgi:hypothetical protein
MSHGVRDTVSILGAIALSFFVLVGSFAIYRGQGAPQVCERQGGDWTEHVDTTSPVYNGWITDKHCRM